MFCKSITRMAFVLMVLEVLVCQAEGAIWTDPNDFNVSAVEGTVLNEKRLHYLT